MCNGDDLILNQFNFEPMKGLEHWRECSGVRVTARASPF